MSLNLHNFPLTGGIEKSVTSTRAGAGTFYDLINFRQKRGERGCLEQTPYFVSNSLSTSSYYDGANTVNESSATPLIGSWRGAFFTQQTARAVSTTTIPIYYQSAIPTGNTAQKQCLIQVVNYISLGLNLGQTVDIVIDSATTFKWRKAGGAYTTLVPIVLGGVSIDGGNVLVYFQVVAGFTVNDTWSLQRTDRMQDTSGAVTLQLNMSMVEYNNTYLLFTNSNQRVMVYDLNKGFIQSIGYRPVYGQQLLMFENHLFVSNSYKDTIVTGLLEVTASCQVSCSDLNNFHGFFPTDVNEADDFNFYDQGDGLDTSTVTTHWRIGLGTLNNSIYVFTPRKSFVSAYLGLPTVFSFKDFSTFGLTLTNTRSIPVVAGDNCLYILRDDGVWKLSNAGFTHIGLALRLVTINNTLSVGAMTMVYDRTHRELVLHLNPLSGGARLYVFQEDFNTWYSRAVSFAYAISSVYLFSTTGLDRRLGVLCSSLRYFTEDLEWSGTPANDDTSGNGLTTPTITLQIFNDTSYYYVKEAQGAQLTAHVETVASSSYSTNTNVIIYLGYSITNDAFVTGTFVEGTEYWINTSLNSYLSLPRVAFRGIQYRLRLVGTVTNKPPGKCLVYGLDGLFYGLQTKTATR